MKANFLLLLMLIASASAQAFGPVEDAVDDPTRLERHRERDMSRKPAQVLRLSGIQPGDTVLDVAPFGGYYTALLSRVVGDAGHVYAVDSGLAIDALQQFNLGALTPTFMADDQRKNVTYSVAKRLDGIGVPHRLDAAFLILNYHDTVWLGEDRLKMNQAIFNMLKPGGRYVVIDHNTSIGVGAAHVNTIHRIEDGFVRDEVLKVGFRLVSEADFLANPQDGHDKHIVDPSIRGRTDRFVLVFEKPSD